MKKSKKSKSRIMVYVFFGEKEHDFWKSDDLIELKDFVKRHFGIEVYWMEMEVGEKFVYSECENYSLEQCNSNFKYLHQIPTIGELMLSIRQQN